MIVIDGRHIGPGARCFLIAEAGVNHNGDPALAHWLIDAAADAGADAVKFQTFDAGSLVTVDAPKAAYQRRTAPTGTQYEMLRALELAHAEYPSLMEHARRRGLVFLSTPFDERSADFLEELGLCAFKISSGDLTNLPMLAHIARKGRPMIVSTGMSDLDEVQEACATIRDAGPAGGAGPIGNARLILLHCVSNYPAVPSDANLAAMRTIANATGAPVGFSDHTLGIEVSLAAVALGACVIEKHLTLDRTMPGPDHAASLEPGDWRLLAQGVRTVEDALGDGEKRSAASEADTARVARRSLVAARDLPAGSVLSPDAIAVRRPGTGLPPRMRDQLVGRSLLVPVQAGSLLTLDLLA